MTRISSRLTVFYKMLPVLWIGLVAFGALTAARVTLRLVHPSRFGNEIAFSPMAPFTLNPFAKNQVAQDLMARVDQARSTRAT